MKTFLNIRLLALTCLVLTMGMLASCEKENNANSGRVELLSFGPTGAMHGDTLRIIGNNLNKVTGVELKSASITQDKFIKHEAELITFVIPVTAEQGYITLKTPDGDIVSKSQLNLEVPVVVSTVTAEARPGENITITGNYLNWVNRVTFARGKAVDTFVSKTMTQLVVKVPTDAQTGTLLLSTGGTEPLQIETANSLVVTLPVPTALAPNPVKHKSNLTITGTNLDLTTAVRFTGVPAAVTSFVSKTATQLVVVVPDTAQKGKVTLVAASGVTSASAQDLDLVLPAVTNLSPIPVDPEGEVTLTGTNLDLVTAITFPAVPAPVTTFVSKSATQIVVKAPAGALKGKLVLSVLNSKLKVTTTQEVQFTGATVVPFKLAVYEDALHSGWQKWDGWNTSLQDMANTEQPYIGTKAIKITYSDPWGGFQLHPASSFPLPNGYTYVRLSIYGGANVTATSKVTLALKATGAANAGPAKDLVLRPGQYTTYEIALADLGNVADINEFIIQNGGTNNITIYVDEIGFF